MATSKGSDAVGPGRGAPIAPVGGLVCEAPGLKQILGALADQIADCDRRHSQALANMQQRLGALGAAAQGMRADLPEDLTPVLDKIEGGMAQLSEQIADADAQQRSPSAAPLDVAPALRSALGAGALETFSRRARGTSKGEIDHFDVVDNASSPRDEAAWDREAADALASLYDSERVATAEPVSNDASETTEPAEIRAEELLRPLPTAQPTVAAVAPATHAADVAALQTKALESERQWLEQRLGDIAGRLEQSLADFGKAEPTDTLDARFDMLESKLTEAMGGAARSVDLAGLKTIESQVEDLAAQLYAVQTHFSRLDTIELELKALADRMTSEGLAEIIAYSAPKAPNSEEIAGAVADRVAQQMPRIELTLQSIAAQLSSDRIAGLIAQAKPNAPDAGAIARLVADHVTQHLPQTGGTGPLPQIDELREMIQSLADERRHGEEQTSTMLDTMQQAMIRLLDRMDSIEQAQFAEPGMPVASQPEYPEPYRQIPDEHANQPVATPSERQRGPAPEPRSQPQPMAAPIAVEPPRSSAVVMPAAASPSIASPPRAEPQLEEMPKPGSREDYIAAARRAARMAAETSANAPEEVAPEPAAQKFRIAAAIPQGRRHLSTAAMAMACLVLVGASFFVVKATLLAPPSQPDQPQTQQQQQPARQSGAPAANPSVRATTPAERKLQGLDDADQQPDDARRAAQRHGSATPTRRTDMMSQNGGPEEAFDGAMANAIPASQIENGPGFPPTVPMALTRDDADAGPAGKGQLPLTIGPNSLRAAAIKGDPSAEFEIGARFAEGRGVTQDLQQAVTWYTRSAAQGFAPAQYRLGSMYERGLGVKTDIARARVWYARAAEQGIVKAMHNLAVLGAGRDATAADYAAAAKWFKAAADHGLTDSQFNLAIMYDSGLGMERDNKQALKWFSLAARSGDEEAARRRESLRQRLPPQEAAELEAELAAWRPKPADAAMNDPRVAGEAWKARAR